MDDNFWYLKKSDLFERLTPEQIDRLESRCKAKTFKRGEIVYLPNDLNDLVLLVSSGRVKLYHITSDGKQALLALVDPGELFGELALLGNSKREEYAETMESTTLILIPGKEIRQLMDEHPSVSVGVTRLMGFRMQRIERRLKSILFRSNRERLIHLLLELAEKYGRPTVEGVLLSIKLSHQDLASIIGSTRETVTVVLGELQDEKSISIEKRRITLPNIEQLAESIDVPPPQLKFEEDLGNRLLRQARMNS
ncbi:Transcriptional regulator, Crp/Fnr family [hydrothermal vent metagenome]|uniref:Transcriptional regulator, Crp/Fnr family n=1 Tax=hydrothermal vent metagenome TaxID=652676 RepID=A0A3B1DE53_9ZZZZ